MVNDHARQREPERADRLVGVLLSGIIHTNACWVAMKAAQPDSARALLRQTGSDVLALVRCE